MRRTILCLTCLAIAISVPNCLGQETSVSSADAKVAASQAAAEGDSLLRRGKALDAVKQFDRSIELYPAQMPYLWQRGIALYFIGKPDEAAEQFAKHRAVNPNDVENAAWHFLCIAKSKSPKIAKEMLLPAPGDRREPMDEVLEMLSTGNPQLVRDRIASVQDSSPGTRASEDASFYGEFYLGLFADAIGNQDEAKARMKAAAKDAPSHYMGDVARVYASFLEKKTAALQP